MVAHMSQVDDSQVSGRCMEEGGCSAYGQRSDRGRRGLGFDGGRCQSYHSCCLGTRRHRQSRARSRSNRVKAACRHERATVGRGRNCRPLQVPEHLSSLRTCFTGCAAMPARERTGTRALSDINSTCDKNAQRACRCTRCRAHSVARAFSFGSERTSSCTCTAGARPA